jgi:hypothetical protein
VLGVVAGLGVVGSLAAAVAFFDLWDRFNSEPVDKKAARAVSCTATGEPTRWTLSPCKVLAGVVAPLFVCASFIATTSIAPLHASLTRVLAHADAGEQGDTDSYLSRASSHTQVLESKVTLATPLNEMVDRADAMRAIRDYVENSNGSTYLVVTGPRGCGKSTLVQAAVQG